MVGLILVRVARVTGVIWLARADAVAALGVAAIVIGISLRLGKRTLDDLMDAVSPALRDEILEAARVPGVLEVRRVRLRLVGADLFADLTLSADRDASLEEAHDIATRVEESVRGIHPQADVVVHIDPAGPREEGMIDRIRKAGARLGLGVHEIRLHDVRGGYSAEMHLETSESSTVTEAHHRASEFEACLRKMIPTLIQITTHLEPAGALSSARRAGSEDRLRFQAALDTASREAGLATLPHDINVFRTEGRLSVSFHCAVDGAASLAAAHALTDDLERRLKAILPELGTVIIHVEPAEDASEGTPSAGDSLDQSA